MDVVHLKRSVNRAPVEIYRFNFHLFTILKLIYFRDFFSNSYEKICFHRSFKRIIRIQSYWFLRKRWVKRAKSKCQYRKVTNFQMDLFSESLDSNFVQCPKVRWKKYIRMFIVHLNNWTVSKNRHSSSVIRRYRTATRMGT